jgi:hypothetical protein
MKKLVLLLVPVLFLGCATTSTQPNLEPFPIKPALSPYIARPIVKRLANGDYEVTPDFVDHGVATNKYLKDIDVWKARNAVR